MDELSRPNVVVRPTRGQRIALIVGLLVTLWLALDLFAAILAPFVAAAVIAYALDPPTTRLARIRLPRGLAALVMIVALLLGVLMFALLLYPLLIAQVALLVLRIPQYATLLQGWASGVLADMRSILDPRS